MYVCIFYGVQNPRCTHKLALKLVQEAGEARRRHPYCLSLDAAGNCLAGLALAGALVRDKRSVVIIILAYILSTAGHRPLRMSGLEP